MKDATAIEQAVDDGLGEVGVVEDSAPSIERLVGGDDDGLVAEVSVVDDVEEDIGGVGTVGEVAELIDGEDGGTSVGGEGLAELAELAGLGEVINEGDGGSEESIEAVLDGAVGDGDGEVGLATAGFAGEDEGAAVGDEVGGEVGAEHGESEGGLEGEVEVVDGLEEGEVGGAGEALDAGLLTVSDLLGEEEGEEVAEGPLLLLGAGGEVAVDARSVGEVESLAERLDVKLGRFHKILREERIGGYPR
jgi:hypothetical protein